MIAKNDEFVGIVDRLGANGEGIIKNGEFIVFVPYTLPTEKIKYKILKVTKNYAFGKVLEVLVPADDRIREVCPVFGKCGGCQLQHFKYSAQLKFKSQLVSDCFKKIAGFDVKVKSTVKSVQEYEYRNKLQLPIGSVNGETQIGFFAENSHRIVPVKNCYIHPSWGQKLISAIRIFMLKNKISGYDEVSKTGLLRHVVCRETDNSFIITLVSTKAEIPHINDLIEELKSCFMNFSLYINVNSLDTNVVFGDEFILKYGAPTYIDDFLGLKYEVGVQSFMQINTLVATKLYQNAVKLLEPDEDTFVIDAYSGAGLMTAMFAKKAKCAFGIEIVPEAVKIADSLAKMNGLSDKMINKCGDCAKILPDMVKDLSSKGKVSVVLDPPRKGCDYSVIEAIKSCEIDKIVYISCNPATLARDVGLLVGSLYYDGNEIKKAVDYTPKYDITSIQPYDMFAQTKHVETLVCLTRK